MVKYKQAMHTWVALHFGGAVLDGGRVAGEGGDPTCTPVMLVFIEKFF